MLFDSTVPMLHLRSISSKLLHLTVCYIWHVKSVASDSHMTVFDQFTSDHVSGYSQSLREDRDIKMLIQAVTQWVCRAYMDILINIKIWQCGDWESAVFSQEAKQVWKQTTDLVVVDNPLKTIWEPTARSEQPTVIHQPTLRQQLKQSTRNSPSQPSIVALWTREKLSVWCGFVSWSAPGESERLEKGM